MTMLPRILSYLDLPVIFPVPAGIVADKSAAGGLYGLMQNVNNYSEALTAPINAGAGFTITPAQLAQGIINITAASGGFNATLPTTAAILAILGPTIPTDGSYAEPFQIFNNGSGQTGTLVAGDASTTITGTATIATATIRTFLLTVTSAITITVQNLGTRAV
jgi:hypothetical protein